MLGPDRNRRVECTHLRTDRKLPVSSIRAHHCAQYTPYGKRNTASAQSNRRPRSGQNGVTLTHPGVLCRNPGVYFKVGHFAVQPFPFVATQQNCCPTKKNIAPPGKEPLGIHQNAQCAISTGADALPIFGKPDGSSILQPERSREMPWRPQKVTGLNSRNKRAGRWQRYLNQ